MPTFKTAIREAGHDPLQPFGHKSCMDALKQLVVERGQTFNPQLSRFVAARLKRRYGVPWGASRVKFALEI